MTLTPFIKNAIYKSMEDKPHDKWPTYDGAMLDRAKFITSSEIANCVRQIKYGKVAAKLGKAPKVTANDWGFFERGHNVEAWAVARILDGMSEATPMFLGKEQVSFHRGKQSGTPDGLLGMPNGNLRVLELKSIDPRTNMRNIPKRGHLDQVQQNMDLVGHMTKLHVEGSHLVYIDASDYTKIVEYVYEPDTDRQRELTKRAKKIHKAKSADDLPAEGLVNRGCTYCSFKRLCSGAVDAANKAAVAGTARGAVAKSLF